MTRLWKEEIDAGSHILRLETLKRLGGAERIVRTHLDSVVSALPADTQDRTVRVFHYLVTPGGSKIAHTVSDLAEYTGLMPDQVASVLEELSRQDIRILRPVRPPDQQAPVRYEIFHDVLAPAVLDWRARYVQAQKQAEAEQRAQEQQQRAEEQARVAERLRQALHAAETAAQEAERQKLIAEQQARIATSRQLATQSRSRYVRLDVALLLSLEANCLADTVEGRSSLLKGALRNPYLTTFLHGHTSLLYSVAFSPDSKTLASGSADNTIMLWDVDFKSWQARACYIANRNLTRAEWKEYIGDIESYRATCPELPIESETTAEGQAGKR
jgi:hypothetical protein